MLLKGKKKTIYSIAFSEVKTEIQHHFDEFYSLFSRTYRFASQLVCLRCTNQRQLWNKRSQYRLVHQRTKRLLSEIYHTHYAKAPEGRKGKK